MRNEILARRKDRGAFSREEKKIADGEAIDISQNKASNVKLNTQSV